MDSGAQKELKYLREE